MGGGGVFVGWGVGFCFWEYVCLSGRILSLNAFTFLKYQYNRMTVYASTQHLPSPPFL